MSWLNKLFGTKTVNQDNTDVIDDELLLNSKGVTQATLDNLSDNKGEENK